MSNISPSALQSLPYHSPRFIVYNDIIYSSSGDYPYEDDNKTIKPHVRCCANCIDSCGLKKDMAINNYKNIDGMPLGSGCVGIRDNCVMNYITRSYSSSRPRKRAGNGNNCVGFIPQNTFNHTIYKRLYIKLNYNGSTELSSDNDKNIVYQVHGRILSINGEKKLYKLAKHIYDFLHEEILRKIKEGFIIEILEHDGRKPVVRSIELRQQVGGKYCSISKQHNTLEEYTSYCQSLRTLESGRLKKLKDTFAQSTDVEQQIIMKGIVERIGLLDILNKNYNNDIIGFMADYFPDLTYRDFVNNE